MKKLYIPYNSVLVEIARKNRKNQTQAEKKIWQMLKNRNLKDYKFLRQKPLDNFIADFYCAELMLVIEVDGDLHSRQKEYDFLRSERLSGYGIRVIRYHNDEIVNNIFEVCHDLSSKIKDRVQEMKKLPPDKGD